MIYHPTVEVICDTCKDNIFVDLTATARGGYDDRNVKHSIKFHSWIIENDMHFCCNECRDKGIKRYKNSIVRK